MVKKARGPRHGTRNKLKQKASVRPTITKFMRNYKKGEKVIIYQEPSSQKGMPFVRYRGRVGTVVGKRGESYLIEIKLGRVKKTLISRPEHLKPNA